MGSDSTRRRVTATRHTRGLVHRVVPTHGPFWSCGNDHAMTLIGTSYQKGRIVNMAVADVLKLAPRQRSYWRLCRTGVVFPPSDPHIDPYFIGLWLGDGSTDRPEITSMDQEVIAYCNDLAFRHGLRCVVTDTPSKAKIIRLAGPHGGDLSTRKNVVHDAVRACVRDRQKVIPFGYLSGDRKQRLALLAGLLDTDGCLDGSCYVFSTTNDVLCDQVLFLARSLGFTAYANQNKTSIKSCGFVGVCWRIHISGDLFDIPVLIARKRCAPRQNPRRTDSPDFRIESIGRGELCRFSLDGDGGYLLGDFTVTGNLTSADHARSKQTRRAISMRLCVYEAAKNEAARRGVPFIPFVESALAAALHNGAQSTTVSPAETEPNKL